MDFTTGTLDTDREILYCIDDPYSLTSLLCVNKHWDSVPNEIFWLQKFIKSFGCSMKKERKIKYKQLYFKLIDMSLDELLLHASKRGYIELFTLERMRFFIQHPEEYYMQMLAGTLSRVKQECIISTMAQNAVKYKYHDIALFLTENDFLGANSRYFLGIYMRIHQKNIIIN